MSRSALNDADFRDPIFRMGAEGYQWNADPLPKQELADDGLPARNGGIGCVSRFEMPVGQMFYRLGSSRYKGKEVDAVTYLDSPWWLEFEQFNEVKRFSDLAAIPITDAIRTLCAVPFAWNN